MTIADRLKHIVAKLPEEVTLVAVSKTKSPGEILEAYHGGQRVFGENKIQEMVLKYEELPEDIEWHMIGHLQRNKVKYMAAFVSLIHGVDSLKLLREINKRALKHNRVIPCLLQIKIAIEESKFGMSEDEALSLLTSEEYRSFKNIRIAGLMGMATFTNNTDQLKNEFQKLKRFYSTLKENYNFTTLSMGMSDDYALAIENGSSMIRVGSAIFGNRNYN